MAVITFYTASGNVMLIRACTHLYAIYTLNTSSVNTPALFTHNKHARSLNDFNAKN